MNDPVRYRVVLLPSGERVAAHCTLREALAYLHGYQEVVQRGASEAVIAIEQPERPAAARSSHGRSPSRRARALQSA